MISGPTNPQMPDNLTPKPLHIQSTVPPCMSRVFCADQQKNTNWCTEQRSYGNFCREISPWCPLGHVFRKYTIHASGPWRLSFPARRLAPRENGIPIMDSMSSSLRKLCPPKKNGLMGVDLSQPVIIFSQSATKIMPSNRPPPKERVQR